ncbi:hypothetical protein EST38_g1403 [Candolleomyces aberdarensis]|uniref:F-box domain-containing protein n=1 Tax=Candolleomyces aberdarensis TaxID=2316362 RepID=A0A4Q2DZF9_9AGAR|nr:hypothetical protein EST38_g1403 [Candolleomyces aberdarensis]
MSGLPDDILQGVIEHLQFDLPDLSSCARVSRKFSSWTRPHIFRQVSLRSNASQVDRFTALQTLLQLNPSLLQDTSHLFLELGDGHRWIFSRILTPPFRTSDPSFYDSLRKQRYELDSTISSVLQGFRNLRSLVISHFTFYPISPVQGLIAGWQHVFGIPTLEKLLMSDISDFPLALLGYATEGLREVEFLRVKLDRRDTQQMWSQVTAILPTTALTSTNPGTATTTATTSSSTKVWGAPVEEGQVEVMGRGKHLRPKALSIRDCYAETIEPVIACALNPNSFLDLGQVEVLKIHPCLAVQAGSYNKLVKTVIAISEVLHHLVWMSSAQHQLKNLDVFNAAFAKLEKIDLIFVDGFGGFPQLLTEIRDLLRGATSQLASSPSLGTAASNPGFKTSSVLQELTLRFDLENLTMHSTPESSMSPNPGVPRGVAITNSNSSGNGSDSNPANDSEKEHRNSYFPTNLSPTHATSTSLYYAHIKYIWKLDEGDMDVLREIDGMLSSGTNGHQDSEEDLDPNSTSNSNSNPVQLVTNDVLRLSLCPSASVLSPGRGSGASLPPAPGITVTAPNATATTTPTTTETASASVGGHSYGYGGVRNRNTGAPRDHRFPNFQRLSTTCVFNSASSFMLDDWKALDVYEACKGFVLGGLPRLGGEGKLHFAFEKM